MSILTTLLNDVLNLVSSLLGSLSAHNPAPSITHGIVGAPGGAVIRRNDDLTLAGSAKRPGALESHLLRLL
jgi:hypothetical protein